jgi:peroxiredoxin Q/BCP
MPTPIRRLPIAPARAILTLMPANPPATVGDPAPDFTLADTNGAPVALSALWADKPVLLVFYPGDDTPVCTAQLCEYRDRWTDFTAAGVAVLGINPAEVARHAGFATKHRLPFPVLADAGGACCAAYGATGWFGGTRRVVVLIARGGRVAWRRETLALFRPKADELLAAVRALDPT